VDTKGFENQGSQSPRESNVQSSRTLFPETPRPDNVPFTPSLKSLEAHQPESESMLSQLPSDIMPRGSHLPCDSEFQNVGRNSSRPQRLEEEYSEVGLPAPPSYRPPSVEKELKYSSNRVAADAHLSSNAKGVWEPPKAAEVMVDHLSASSSSLPEKDLNATHESGTQTTPRLENRLPDAFKRMHDIEMKFRITLDAFEKDDLAVAAQAGG